MYCFLLEEFAIDLHGYQSHEPQNIEREEGQRTIIIQRFTASMNMSNQSTNHINNNFGL
jgi:hypothetical protein